MKLSVYDFIHRGYFPKELPPAFNTYHFAVEYDKVCKEWNTIQSNPDSRLTKDAMETDEAFKERKKYFKNPVSVPTTYSIAKGKLCRRNLAVVNPVNFLPLAMHIDDNIADIVASSRSSCFSQSVPTYDTDIHSRCYRANSDSVMTLIKKKLSCARNKKVEIKIDINNFYPSIYTHSIVWTMVGKERAKAIWKKYGNRPIPSPTNKEERMYNIGYLLDEYVEHCQDKQTSGIPVGPDCSFIIAELMIAYVDKEIHRKFPDITGCRYYDDYTLYTSTKEEAESLVKYVQSVLNGLELSVNEAKLEINEAPRSFLSGFAEELSPFDFDAKKTETVLIRYFNLLWKLCDIHPDKIATIVKYGLKPLGTSSLRIESTTKDLFESLLYKTVLLVPSSLDLVQRLLTGKNISPSKTALEELVGAIIECHAPLNHHHEISWVLWFCKVYDLVLTKENAIQVLEMSNPICTLMLLDYINCYASAGTLKTDKDVKNHIKRIENTATPMDLFGENWILLYEGAFHGWLNTKNAVNNNPYFKELLSKGISFYDKDSKADYHSYVYIESLSYNIYPKEMHDQAKDFRKEVFKEVYNNLFEELEAKNVSDDEANDTKSAYKHVVKEQNMENNIFEKILSELFHRQEPELDEYVNSVIRDILEIIMY